MSDAAIAAVPVAPTPAAGEVTQAPAKPVADKAAEPVAKVRVRGYERAAKVKAKLEEEPESATTEERAEPAEPAEKPEPAKAAPTVDEAAQRRAERLERIRKAQERERKEERQRAQERASRAAPDQHGELEKLRKRVAELEPYNEVFSSEEALLEAAERRGMSAEKLVSWMKTRLSDPAAVARQQTKSEADKLREEMRQEREAFRKELEELRQQREEERQQLAAQQKATDFVTRAKGSTKSHPHTARFVARHGEHGLIGFANQFVAPLLRADYSLDELHDHLEQILDEVQLNEAGAPEQAAGPSPKNGAEQPSTTLSNRLVAQRGDVVEETPLARLPRSERVARLKARLGGE